jgi:hypothetical protein
MLWSMWEVWIGLGFAQRKMTTALCVMTNTQVANKETI